MPIRRPIVATLTLLLSLTAPLARADAPAKTAKAAATSKAGVAILSTAAAKTQAEQSLSVEQLRRYLSFIASDALRGRETPSPGLDAAAQFIAFHLSRLGLRPLGDNGTYFQHIALRHVLPDEDRCRATLAGETLRLGPDFLPTLGRLRGGSGTVTNAPLIYVSHGWVIPSRRLDAYQGRDVRGKVMVVSGRSEPSGAALNVLSPSAKAPMAAVSPAAYAAAHGAVGILYLPREDFDEGNYTDLRRSVREGRGEALPTDPNIEDVPPEPAGNAVPALFLSPEAARRLFVGERINGDDLLARSLSGEESEPFDLAASKRASFTAAYIRDTIYTQNVVAALDGADPVLKNQYVGFGAHYDHLGVGEPDARGDTIFNGADDDGSGTAALLALAEAFAGNAARPRRSLLFVWHCGEEKGLWGSSFFTAHPTVPLKNLVTMLNIDMIGHSRTRDDQNPKDDALSGPNSVYVIGSRAMSSKVAEVSESVNHSYLNLQFDYRYDDPDDPNEFFYRSDHFNYARRGVPIIFYFDGEHADYHQQSDEVSRIDFAKMLKVTRTVFLTAATLANLPNPPVVDRKLPFTKE